VAQIELFTKPNDYPIGVSVLPKHLTRRSHASTWTRSAWKLTVLRPERPPTSGVPVEGPYKPEHYGY